MPKIRKLLLVLLSLLGSFLFPSASRQTHASVILQPPNIRQAQDSKPKLTTLVPGEPIQGELKREETQSYGVTLKAEQYLNVLVRPNSIDVKIALLDPAGRPIVQMDWEGEGAAESLWTQVPVEGDYEIRITGTAKSLSDPRYSIRLVKIGDLQTASAEDQTYVKAYQLFRKAGTLNIDNDRASLQQAAKIYEQTLPLWREVKDRVGEAYSLDRLSVVYFKLGDREKELPAIRQALEIWQVVRNHERSEAEALHHLGSIYQSQGHPTEALECEKKALELARLIGNQLIEFSALTNIGAISSGLGYFQAALEAHQQALSLQRKLGDIEGQARSLSNISAVFFGLGEYQEALNYCKQALPLRRAAKDRRGEAITLANIGSNYRELGEPQISLEYYQQALAILNELNDPVRKAALLDGIGRVYYDFGEYRKAIEYHQKSLELGQSISNPRLEAGPLDNLGRALGRLGEHEKALKYFEEALRIRRSTGDRRAEALTLQNAGELYRQLGDAQKARAYFDQGLQISRDIKNRFYEANFLYAIARTQQSGGHPDEARRNVEAAIDIIESSRTSVSSSDLRASFFASKQEFYECEIDLLMQSYATTRNDEDLTQAFNFSERQRARTFLDTLEGSGAKVRSGIAPEVLVRERALRARLNQEAENQIKLMSGQHTPEDAAAISRRVQDATSDYEQVRQEIRSSSQHYAALTQPKPLNLTEVQSHVLDNDTLLLEYALGAERSYVWAVTNHSIAGFELPPRAELERLARRAYELMTERNRFIEFEKADARRTRIENADSEYCRVAAELSRILLTPIRGNAARKRLLIVSDGALQYLSFAALALPGGSPNARPETFLPLITKYEVVNLPSASTLGLLRKELAGRKPAPKTIAILADPVFDKNDDRVKRNKETVRFEKTRQENAGQDAPEPYQELTRSIRDLATPESGALLPLPRLQYTRREADAISALAPAAQREEAIDFAASRATAMDPRLGQYRYVHFATHALLNNRHPELSGIVLSLVDENGKDQDGFLLANEIYNLNIPAELVVLSGCKTGLGKEIKGEGIVSLTRSFMYAGAARLVVSLWDVNDRSTAELMTQFYRGALGSHHLTSAAAMRGAQITMSKSARWKAPYYWAAFVLQGEYH